MLTVSVTTQSASSLPPSSHPRAPASSSLPECCISPVPLIDIGSNLTHKKLKSQLSSVIERAQQANVTAQIITGLSVNESKAAFKLVEQHAHPSYSLYCTAGVHPHNAKECNSLTIPVLESLLADPRVVAVGETGLDFDRNFSDRESQLRWFEEQVQLAIRVNKPLFCHERAAHTDFVEILRRNGYDGSEGSSQLPPVVVHCFTGTEAELTTYLELGFYIGITGFIGKKNRGRDLRSFIHKIPLDRLMLETDAPFMQMDDPRLHRFMRVNEPCTLPAVLGVVADCYGLGVEEVGRATAEATRTFFRLQ